MNFIARRPGQSFTEYLEAAFADLLAGLHRDGVAPARARLDVNVTDHADDDVVLVARHVAGLGLAGVRLVDGRVPARPGTTPEALLGPVATESMAVARARRILGERRQGGLS